MPNFDTGHYFLTTLAPILPGGTTAPDGTAVSHAQRLRTLLGVLPTALQTPATERIGLQSPFARNRRTHFCRYVVIGDVIFNGRTPRNTLVALVLSIAGLRAGDPLVPEPVDRLSTPYLLFTADIDAVEKDGDPLPASLSPAEQDRIRDAYAERLWETMERELREIYEHCVGFESVQDARGFADYLRRCQVETTMPFHDYWTTPPAIEERPLATFLFAAVVPLLLALVYGPIGWAFRRFGYTCGLFGHARCVLFFGLLLTLGGLVALARYVLAEGAKPLPPAEHGDLVSVLKALYVQQTFTQVVIGLQGKTDAEIHAEFGRYVTTHVPDDRFAPTQSPGVISSGSTTR